MANWEVSEGKKEEAGVELFWLQVCSWTDQKNMYVPCLVWQVRDGVCTDATVPEAALAQPARCRGNNRVSASLVDANHPLLFYFMHNTHAGGLVNLLFLFVASVVLITNRIRCDRYNLPRKISLLPSNRQLMHNPQNIHALSQQ